MATQTRRAAGDDEGQRILGAIRQLARALRLFDREAQARYGISAAQMLVLHALEQDDVLSLNALAERTATDQSSASVVVRRLIDAGYVTRTAKKEDRRHAELRLTAKGRTMLRKSPSPAQEKILEAVEALPPRERKQLAGLLERFVEGLAER